MVAKPCRGKSRKNLFLSNNELFSYTQKLLHIGKSVFNGNNDREHLKISDEDDVKIIETNRVWKICEDIKIKTEILDEIEDFSANDELVVVEDENPFEKRIIGLTTRKDLACTICRIDFPNEDKFRSHMILHTRCELYRCTISSQLLPRSPNLGNRSRACVDIDRNYQPIKFQDESTVRIRGRLPKEERCFECGIYQKKCSRDRKASYAKKKSFECSICKKNFLRRSGLRAHSIVHTADSPYKCDLCPAKFKRSSVLKTHKLTHTDIRRFECDICKHRFHLKGALKHHILAHYGVRPYKCKDCGKRYRRSWGLKVHMYRHTGVKRFECDLCKDRFSIKTKLAKHIYQHTGEKPYKCELCARQYDEKYLLKSHKCPMNLDTFSRCKLNAPDRSNGKILLVL
ncbi:gastrula zinc finger protein XlCGF46.1-like [Polistes fuscatus]|uniref:gastrula zinc finger protein XlCGF46.1-like n=1 Tax=Polistes fuscatus TaxID=30207 RepID=UPI001CA9827D|nr:gastrula zinc finger protein XlCGF46.1-like [Polistes fuscatus]